MYLDGGRKKERKKERKKKERKNERIKMKKGTKKE